MGAGGGGHLDPAAQGWGRAAVGTQIQPLEEMEQGNGGGRVAEAGGEQGDCGLGSTRGCAEVAAPRGGNEEGGKGAGACEEVGGVQARVRGRAHVRRARGWVPPYHLPAHTSSIQR
jgi:hypothetical protein